MRGAPDSAPRSLILPSPPIRFKARRFQRAMAQRFSGQIALRPLLDLYGCYCLNLAGATTIRRHFDLLKAEDGRIEQLANSYSA